MTITHTLEEYEHDGRLYDLELKVEFTASKYHPGDYFNPPEGGEIEDTNVTVTKANDEDGDPVTDPALIAAIQKRINGEPLPDAIMDACLDYEPADDRADRGDY